MWNMDVFRHDLHSTVKYSRALSAPTTTKLFPSQTQGGTVDEASSTMSLKRESRDSVIYGACGLLSPVDGCGILPCEHV